MAGSFYNRSLISRWSKILIFDLPYENPAISQSIETWRGQYEFLGYGVSSFKSNFYGNGSITKKSLMAKGQ